MRKETVYNINPAERLVRLAFSCTLALTPLIVDAPLGGLALLPLLAIYPGLTAAFGWDPLLAAAQGLRHDDRDAAAGHHDLPGPA